LRWKIGVRASLDRINSRKENDFGPRIGIVYLDMVEDHASGDIGKKYAFYPSLSSTSVRERISEGQEVQQLIISEPCGHYDQKPGKITQQIDMGTPAFHDKISRKL
jgi:hypothetical protein